MAIAGALDQGAQVRVLLQEGDLPRGAPAVLSVSLLTQFGLISSFLRRCRILHDVSPSLRISTEPESLNLL